MADIRRNPTVLDDFDRPDEDPLSGGGNWAQVDSALWTPLVLKDFEVTHQLGSETSMSYWTPTSYDNDDAECWGYMIGGGAGGLGAGVALFSVVGGVNTVTGYRVRTIGQWHLQKWTNGSYTDIDSFFPGDTDSGRILLIRRNGNDVEGWRSGIDDFDTWELVVSATDTDYTTNLYAALWIGDVSQTQLQEFAWFGAGGRTNRTQIYRWIKN